MMDNQILILTQFEYEFEYDGQSDSYLKTITISKWYITVVEWDQLDDYGAPICDRQYMSLFKVKSSD